MKLIAISPEGERDDEAAVLSDLVALGLERYHVRKPAWSHEQLRHWLSSLERHVRMRCVVHSHHDLVDPQVLLGRHWRASHAAPAEPPSGFSSRTCHTVAELEGALGYYSAVFFSPVFPSISKEGRVPNTDLEVIGSILRSRSEARRRTEVIALGGITAERIFQCAAWGFEGVAALGALWQSDQPVEAFKILKEAVEVTHVP